MATTLPPQDLGDGITVIDTGYDRPGRAACYLLQEQGRAALIETGVNHSVPGILKVMGQQGIAPEQIDYIIPTHVHLDHAGGAGQLMRACPNAQLVMHPRGARHMIDPSKLAAGVKAVYGEEVFERDYGELLPVDAQRVIEAPDGFSLDLNGRTLTFLDTPGHARHHFCVYDEVSRGVFTGDTFGLSYPELDGRDHDTQKQPFCFPTTTPVQFEPGAMHDSIERIMALKPQRIYLTHYSAIEATQSVADQLHGDIDRFVELVDEIGLDEMVLREAMMAHLLKRLKAMNPGVDEGMARNVLAPDMMLNVQGLMLWAEKR